jgi:hypothetical protein
VACCSPDVQLEPLLRGVEGGYRGHAGVRQWLRDRAQGWDLQFEYGPFRPAGVPGGWIASGRISMRSRREGVPIEQPLAGAVRVEDGLIAWFGFCRTEEEALQELERAG